ncbi:acyltransferase family protein [Pseudomonas violetae]|uniref:Acyltransferase n=1 Tax=Pseudomonas violetae TaxID=2915813 RepID=A0ABT0F6B1_9PSED|nr:acyltransferase [Pseudomonas violetae]MCK1793564.1 acyltransferase [Pseudomonas violetae]
MRTEYNLETALISASIVLMFIIFSTLWKRKIESAEVPHQYKFINGLRGIAAVFVFVNHAPFVLTNLGVTNSRFSSWGQIYPNLGSFGVQIFFCITGFLFFDKIMKSKSIDWNGFFVARLKRVAPLYYASSIIVVLIATIYSGQTILNRETIATLAGIISFNFIDNPMKIGDVSLIPLSSVTWTLVHEWRFYAVLPMVAICYRSKYRNLTLLVTVILAAIDLGTSAVVCWTYFLTGMIAAAILKVKIERCSIKCIANITAVASFILTCGLLEIPGYGYERYLITSLFFLCVTISNPRALHFKFLNRLSDISYSIYLLHLPILFVTFKSLALLSDLSGIGKYTFWAVNFIVIPVVVSASALTFIYIEKRFMLHSKYTKPQITVAQRS